MKKTYKKPTTKLVKIQHRSIIMNSQVKVSTQSAANPELGMSSRQERNSMWDDYAEEE